MTLVRWGFYLILIMIVSACRNTPTSAPLDEYLGDSIAPSGQWSLEYTRSCTKRASRLLDVTITDEVIVFDYYVRHHEGMVTLLGM